MREDRCRGGIVLDLDGTEKLNYAWGLGNTTNNKAEALAICQGLVLLEVREIKHVSVGGFFSNYPSFALPIDPTRHPIS
jgi:hypothetical protein